MTDVPGRPDTVTIDHIIPRVNGGRTSYGNCVAACIRCNCLRGCIGAFQFFNLLWGPVGRNDRRTERVARKENEKLSRAVMRSRARAPAPVLPVP
jgi:HNH endonuclease